MQMFFQKLQQLHIAFYSVSVDHIERTELNFASKVDLAVYIQLIFLCGNI